jgi:hypothetical protein
MSYQLHNMPAGLRRNMLIFRRMQGIALLWSRSSSFGAQSNPLLLLLLLLQLLLQLLLVLPLLLLPLKAPVEKWSSGHWWKQMRHCVVRVVPPAALVVRAVLIIGVGLSTYQI